ncbi:MAG: hypothetical protein RLY20_560 [Verrucomicrobiota bacterium]|jgi:hypothetical protein
MLLTLLMIFSPEAGWSRAADASRSIFRVVCLHLLPMVLLGCIAEAYGLLNWGRAASPLAAPAKFSLEQVLPYEACQFVLGFVTVLIIAFVLRRLGNTFHSRQGFGAALTASTFSLGPVFLLRVCDAFPAINPWVSWLIGAVLMAAIMYQGIPRVLQLDPAHAFGVYLSSAMVAVLVSGLGRLFVLSIIQLKLLGIRASFI